MFVNFLNSSILSSLSILNTPIFSNIVPPLINTAPVNIIDVPSFDKFS